MKAKKLKIKPGALAVILLIFVSSYLLVGFYKKNINFGYQPYVADSVSLVFTDQKNNQSKSVNSEFLLTDIKKNQAAGQKAAVINNAGINLAKNISPLLTGAENIYLKIFSDYSFNFSEFINSFSFNLPFEFKADVNENSILKIQYDLAGKKVNFILPGQRLDLNGSSIKLNDVVIFTVTDVEANSLIKIGDLVVDFSTYQNDSSTSLADLFKNKIRFYHSIGKNLLENDNFSFEAGLWEKTAADCSAYLPGRPQIGSAIVSDATAGKNALQLFSNNHFACTLRSFPVKIENDKLYKLAFDYKNLEGGKVQYYYNFKNGSDQLQEKFGLVNVADFKWHTFSNVIIPQIQGVDSFSLYFYAPSDGSKNVVNLYDNVRLIAFVSEREVAISRSDFPANFGLSNWLTLKSGNNSFSYLGSDINLLKDFNPSFEAGLWENEVSDCSNYLPGRPQIGSAIVSDATAGKNALQLFSNNHFACTLRSFPVKIENDKLYKLAFDYKNLEGGKVQYYYNFKNEAGKNQDNFESFEATDNQWHTFEAIVSSDVNNVDTFQLYFYAPSDGSKNIVDLYDNVKLSEFAPKGIYSYYLYAKNNIEKIRPESLTAKPINVWKYQLSLQGIKNPFLLVYPKKYSQTWKIYSADRKSIAEANHFQINNYDNGWWIDAKVLCEEKFRCQKNSDGSYDLDLTMENSFNRLTDVIFGGCAALFIFLLFYARKN
ncbi:MAG: hypothetical protein WC768_03460 [Patescibacteria group bacterium]|jgi:hypothetical protein